MQYIVKILTVIVPYILRFIDRHSDEYLSILNRRISKFLGDDEVSTVRLFIINSKGEPINNCVACFRINIYGDIQKKSAGNILSITGFKAGKHSFEILADGYESTLVDIIFDEDNSIVEKTVVLKNGTN